MCIQYKHFSSLVGLIHSTKYMYIFYTFYIVYLNYCVNLHNYTMNYSIC